MGSAHAYLTKCQRPESIVHEHMADREDRVPSVTLDLDDMRLRYDAYQVGAASSARFDMT